MKKDGGFSPQCPVPDSADWRGEIRAAHGGGGRAMHRLIEKIFIPAFDNPHLRAGLDGAIVDVSGSPTAAGEDLRGDFLMPGIFVQTAIFSALQTGVVDGTDNPHSNLFTQKMHEVQKHMIITDHNYLGYAVIVNKKFWEGLPADVRGQLEQAMKEATVYANTIAKEENDAALEGVRKSGKTAIYVPTKEEKLAFKKAMAPVHVKMADRVGKELLQSIYKETGFDPTKL